MEDHTAVAGEEAHTRGRRGVSCVIPEGEQVPYHADGMVLNVVHENKGMLLRVHEDGVLSMVSFRIIAGPG